MEFCNNNKTSYYSITIHITICIIVYSHYSRLLFNYYSVIVYIIASIIHITVYCYCAYTISCTVHITIDALFMLLFTCKKFNKTFFQCFDHNLS